MRQEKARQIVNTKRVIYTIRGKKCTHGMTPINVLHIKLRVSEEFPGGKMIMCSGEITRGVKRGRKILMMEVGEKAPLDT